MLAVVFVILILLILFGRYIPNRNYRNRDTTDVLYEKRSTKLYDFEDVTSIENEYSSKLQNNVTLGEVTEPVDSIIPSDWWLCLEKIQNAGKHLDAVYCLGYRIGTSVDDNWTVRINNFKKGGERETRKAEITLHAAAPSLFKHIGVDPVTTIVIPVLGSQETSAASSSKNARLAKAIADATDAKFMLDCLSKNKHAPLHLQPDRDGRDRALSDANYRASKLNDRLSSVIIVDDIVTRKKTMLAVADAIHQSNPWVEIYGFALGRHVRRDYLPVSIEEANTHIPRELAEIWDQA